MTVLNQVQLGTFRQTVKRSSSLPIAATRLISLFDVPRSPGCSGGFEPLYWLSRPLFVRRDHELSGFSL